MAEKEISQEAQEKAQEQSSTVEVSGKVEKMLEEIKSLSSEDRACLGVSMVKQLSVLELSEWVKALEEEFGVSAAAMAVPAAGGASAAPQGGGQEEAAKDSFTVVLTAAGDKKIQVIKEVRAITSLGLKEAKALVDEAPKPVKEDVPEEEANEIKSKLEAVGASVELK
jgi:large subunit ribosomal protein L7/L12